MMASRDTLRIAEKIAEQHAFYRDQIGVQNIATIVEEAFEIAAATQVLGAIAKEMGERPKKRRAR